MGIIVPEVDTKEQALKLVQSMRYPPQRGAKYPQPVGNRGCCPGDAPRYWGLSLHDYFVRADVWPLNPDGELLAIVMVESREAIKNVNEILSVPGHRRRADRSARSEPVTRESDCRKPIRGRPKSRRRPPRLRRRAWRARRSAARSMPDFDKRLAQGFKLFPLPRGASTAAR